MCGAKPTSSYRFSSPFVFPLHVLGVISGLLPLPQLPVLKALWAQQATGSGQPGLNGSGEFQQQWQNSVCNERPQLGRRISFLLVSQQPCISVLRLVCVTAGYYFN